MLTGTGSASTFNRASEGALLPAEDTSVEVLDQVRAGNLPAADALSRVDLASLQSDELRIAFAINVYSALMLHALAVRRPTGSVPGNVLLYFTSRYRIGPWVLSLNDLEHGVLRRNARPWPLPWRLFGPADPRRSLMPSRLDPRIHFTLNCGARSCPPIRAYRAAHLDAQLTLATEVHVREHTRVDRTADRIWIPALCRLYAKDFGPDRPSVLRFIAAALEEPDRSFVAERAGRLRVRVSPYDWSMVSA